MKNKEEPVSPSSDSNDKSPIIVRTKRAQKRLLSGDDSDHDQKSCSASTENVKTTPKKTIKQMKTDEKSTVEIKEEVVSTPMEIKVSIEQKK